MFGKILGSLYNHMQAQNDRSSAHELFSFYTLLHGSMIFYTNIVKRK